MSEDKGAPASRGALTVVLHLAVATVSTSTLAKGVFFSALSAEFRLPRQALAGLMSINLVVGSIVAAIGALALVRFASARLVIVIGLLLVSASCGAAALARHYWQLATAFAFLNGSLVSLIAVPTLIIQTEFRRPPLVLAWVLAGTTTCGLLLIPALALAIGAYGWRLGYSLLAIANLAVAILCLAVVPLPRNGIARQIPVEAERPLPWGSLAVLMTAYCCYMVILSAHLVHFIPMITDRGLGLQMASAAAAAMFLMAAISKIGVGWMAGRARPILLLTLVYAVDGAGLLLLGRAQEPIFMMIGLLAYGLTFTVPTVLLPLIFVERLGTARFVASYSTIGLLATAVSAFGPVFAGGAFDRFGSYAPALVVFSAFAFVAAALLWSMMRNEATARDTHVAIG